VFHGRIGQAGERDRASPVRIVEYANRRARPHQCTSCFELRRSIEQDDPGQTAPRHAERGAGSFLNGERLPIKERVPKLGHAMAEVDFKRLTPALAKALAVSPPYASQRNFGASTLEWCYVAAGRFDVYLHGGQKLWDYAAGSLILEEAGGLMSTLDNDDFWADGLWKRSVLAARDPGLFETWKHWVRARM